LELFESPQHLSTLAATVQDAAGVVVIPALNGLRVPRSDPGMTASLTGMTSATTRAHVAYAFLEGIAHLIRMNVEANAAVAQRTASELVAGGGLAGSEPLMQLHADLLGVPVRRCTRSSEASLRGAAFLAG